MMRQAMAAPHVRAPSEAWPDRDILYGRKGVLGRFTWQPAEWPRLRTPWHTEAGASIPPEAMLRSPQDGRMGPPIFDYNAPKA